MKNFAPQDNIEDAIDAVLTDGVAALEGQQAWVVPYAARLLKGLAPYLDVAPTLYMENISEIGHRFYVVDNNRYAVGSEALKQAVRQVETVCYTYLPC